MPIRHSSFVIRHSLHLLPERDGNAAENMACDFLLLKIYPDADAIRFRHYGWRQPAFTFGYSQKYAWVRAQAPEDVIDFCRRPTGGGIVDHRSDWTYTLVLPRSHPAWEIPAGDSYRLTHECLAGGLIDTGRAAALQAELPGGAGGGPEGVCFQRAERFDVVDPGSGAKLAGAAQKRTKQGLLLQGSIDRKTVGDIDWDAFGAAFVKRLAAALQAEASDAGWPDWPWEDEDALVTQYSSEEWLAFR